MNYFNHISFQSENYINSMYVDSEISIFSDDDNSEYEWSKNDRTCEMFETNSLYTNVSRSSIELSKFMDYDVINGAVNNDINDVINDTSVIGDINDVISIVEDIDDNGIVKDIEDNIDTIIELYMYDVGIKSMMSLPLTPYQCELMKDKWSKQLKIELCKDDMKELKMVSRPSISWSEYSNIDKMYKKSTKSAISWKSFKSRFSKGQKKEINFYDNLLR